MKNFLLIFLYLSIGALLRRSGRMPVTAPSKLNHLVIYVALPALVLLQIPKLIRSAPPIVDLMIPLSMPWLLILLSWAFFAYLGRKKAWSKEQIGALVLTAGLANTSFVGIPVLEALMGQKAIPLALVIDQGGSFLTLSTLGFTIAAFYSGNQVHPWHLARRIVFFPPFIALMVAVIWGFSPFLAPELLTTPLTWMAATLVPAALVSVGLQLNVSPSILKKRWAPLSLGLSFKLVLAPLFFIALYAGLFAAHDQATHVTILQSAMAPMITAAIVATQFRLDPELANLMVGIGIPLSIATVSLWHGLWQIVF